MPRVRLEDEAERQDERRQAEWRLERHMQWCELWADFLEERSWRDGRLELARVRLRKARGSLGGLVSQGALFAHLDPEPAREGPCRPPTTRWRAA